VTENATAANEILADVRAALGAGRTDLVLERCQVVDVYSEQIYRSDIAIRGSHIVAVRENYRGQPAETIDCEKLYAVPGFVQLGTCCLPGATSETELTQTSTACGITSWITEDHSERAVLPAGSSIGKGAAVRSWRKLIGGSFVAATGNTHAEVRVDSSVANHHICTTLSEVAESIRSGLTVFLAESEGSNDLAAMLVGIRDKGLDTSRLCLCLPHACDPISKTHAAGFSFARIFQMASLNPATHFGLDHVIGSISPGRKADILLLSNLDKFPPALLIFDGKIIAKEGLVRE
jgi:adenine deaminase